MFLLTIVLYIVHGACAFYSPQGYNFNNVRPPWAGAGPPSYPGQGVGAFAGAGPGVFAAAGPGAFGSVGPGPFAGVRSGVFAGNTHPGGAYAGIGPDGKAYTGFGAGPGSTYSGVGPHGNAFSGVQGGAFSAVGPHGHAISGTPGGAFTAVGPDGVAFSGASTSGGGIGSFSAATPTGAVSGTSFGKNISDVVNTISDSTSEGAGSGSLPDGGTFASAGNPQIDLNKFLLMKKSCFCADNSDECDEKEITRVYKPKASEVFMPPCCIKKTYKCGKDEIYRTFDGSCNNLEHPDWGVPNSTYSRLLPPNYGNGLRMPRRTNNNRPLPSARTIRVALFPTGTTENTLWNINAMIWGQFVAHDMSLLKQPDHEFSCCTPEGKYVSKRTKFCYPIKIPPTDPTMGKEGFQCINFTRTVTDKDLGCADENSPAQQINAVTDYLDLSNVYGLNQAMSDELRTNAGGQLKIVIRNGHAYAPIEKNLKVHCKCNLAHENTCYKTGDSRSNQNPQLAILQILFVKEHNRIAAELETINPHWDDETLFQEARRILIAIYQRITYYEWLPIFLGKRNILDAKVIYDKPGFINDYNATLPPSITNEHAHAAYRFFHTHIVGIINYLNQNREKTGSFALSDFFNRPILLEAGDNIEKLTMGMMTQNLGETDNIYAEQVTDKLFACGKKFGIDLRSADIQRDRDHALSYYNDYRKYCGLKEAKSFEDYGDLIPAEFISKLKAIYTDYRDVDLTVGGALEALAPGAQVGPTFLCILNEQFARSRKADRFWFENEDLGFTEEQLEEIRKATVSKMFCDSGEGIKDMQPMGFTLIFPDFNPVKKCSEIHALNLTLWKEDPSLVEWYEDDTTTEYSGGKYYDDDDYYYDDEESAKDVK